MRLIPITFYSQCKCITVIITQNYILPIEQESFYQAIQISRKTAFENMLRTDYLLSEQYIPVNPSAHSQVNMLISSEQLPPFKHGLLSHSFISGQ